MFGAARFSGSKLYMHGSPALKYEMGLSDIQNVTYFPH